MVVRLAGRGVEDQLAVALGYVAIGPHWLRSGC